MKVLSLFDGMACGMLAMQKAGIEVDRYVAYEIDKYAVQTSSHNFPMIEHKGDVFKADFTEFSGFDFLVGGSPCTYWSIAQKNNRETEASGLGWELFSQYVRALHEAKPRFFIYENNKSMSKAIRASITETFGFEAVCINSALVSAQNRQRLYWVGKRNSDGTYSKVHVDQPEDRGILLRDVLDSVALRDKANCLCGNRCGTSLAHDLVKAKHNYAAEPIRIPEYGSSEKSRPVTWSYPKQGLGQIAKNCFPENPNKQLYDYIAQPVIKPLSEKEMEYMVRETKDGRNHFDFGHFHDGNQDKSRCITATIAKGVPYNVICDPVRIGTYPNNAKNQDYDSQQYRIYSTEGKSVNLCGNGGGMGAKTGLYAIPVQFEGDRPIKAVSGSDGKEYPVYEVKDGFIIIKDKQYAIKLADGFYIIRKLTVTECKRLQTVPEWFEFPVSDSQAYKMLGNGWTVDVIAHLIEATQLDQVDLFGMVLEGQWGGNADGKVD